MATVNKIYWFDEKYIYLSHTPLGGFGTRDDKLGGTKDVTGIYYPAWNRVAVIAYLDAQGYHAGTPDEVAAYQGEQAVIRERTEQMSRERAVTKRAEQAEQERRTALRLRQLNGQPEATAKQYEFLRGLGWIIPENRWLTKFEASKMIDGAKVGVNLAANGLIRERVGRGDEGDTFAPTGTTETRRSDGTGRCDHCGKPDAYWNPGAGRFLCNRHWDEY